MIMPASLEHDPEKWKPVFGRIMLQEKIERDDDSKKVITL
jgi:hypothetical protein